MASSLEDGFRFKLGHYILSLMPSIWGGKAKGKTPNHSDAACHRPLRIHLIRIDKAIHPFIMRFQLNHTFADFLLHPATNSLAIKPLAPALFSTITV